MLVNIAADDVKIMGVIRDHFLALVTASEVESGGDGGESHLGPGPGLDHVHDHDHDHGLAL